VTASPADHGPPLRLNLHAYAAAAARAALEAEAERIGADPTGSNRGNVEQLQALANRLMAGPVFLRRAEAQALAVAAMNEIERVSGQTERTTDERDYVHRLRALLERVSR
jgi:hypothetical protein